MKKISVKINKEEVRPKHKSLLETLNTLQFPENLSEIKILNPKKLKFDIIARLKCANCGLY